MCLGGVRLVDSLGYYMIRSFSDYPQRSPCTDRILKSWRLQLAGNVSRIETRGIDRC